MEVRQFHFCQRVRTIAKDFVIKYVEIIIIRAGKITRAGVHGKIRVRKAHDEFLFIVKDIAFHDAIFAQSVRSFFPAVEKLRRKIGQSSFRAGLCGIGIKLAKRVFPFVVVLSLVDKGRDHGVSFAVFGKEITERVFAFVSYLELTGPVGDHELVFGIEHEIAVFQCFYIGITDQMDVLIRDIMFFQDASVRGIVHQLHGVVLHQIAEFIDVIGGLRFKNAQSSVGKDKHIARIRIRIEFVVQLRLAREITAADPANSGSSHDLKILFE